jgi:hypothetical protein
MVDASVPATERQQVVMDSTFTRLNVSAMAPSYTTSTGFLSFTAFSTDEKGRCLSFHPFSFPVPPLAHLCCCNKAVPIIVLERSTALLYDCLQPETHTPNKKKKKKKPLVITLFVHQGYHLNLQKRRMHAARVILLREGEHRERERQREMEKEVQRKLQILLNFFHRKKKETTKRESHKKGRKKIMHQL